MVSKGNSLLSTKNLEMELNYRIHFSITIIVLVGKNARQTNFVKTLD